jgi:prepilin-type N-terminal cleavage/methylation domain-containing protein
MTLSSLKRGFTLIELLLVIGIIAILAAIVIVAINPTKQLGDARDAQRRSDVNTILNAVYQYSIDNQGNVPGTIPDGTPGEICRVDEDADTGDCNNAISLDVLSGAYIVKVPVDPREPATSTGTNYFIYKEVGSDRITVTAPGYEQAPSLIQVTR